MKVGLFYPEMVIPQLEFLVDITEKKIKRNDESEVLLLTIAGQESNWSARLQVGGPARSFWQFEKGGGVAGVLQHAATRDFARKACTALDIPSDVNTVYEAMAWNDTLACCMARLLLWTDPAPLPALGQVEAAWQYYLRCWRPGAPHPEVWPVRYTASLAAMKTGVI